MNSWIITLIALCTTAAKTGAFAPEPIIHTWSHRSQTSLSLPYQLYDSEITHAIRPSPILGGSVLKFPAESSVEPPTKIKSISPGLNDVKLSFLPSGNEHFPLVVSPKADNSLAFLSSFLKINQTWVEEKMRQYGAILFRGFDVDTASEVETAIRAFEPKLNNSYRGTSPRNAQEGSHYVFSAAEVPSHYPIAQHLEMSFLPSPPRRLFFSALQAPKLAGGETALADFRQVYRDLPRKLRDKLASKKLRYTRTHHKKGARFTSDIASMQSWSDVFGTTDKAEVERIAAKENMPMRWEGRNQDTFVSEYVSEPFQLHPETREPVWFNHAQVFHWTTFPAELFLAFRRTKDWRFLVRSIALGFQALFLYGMLGRKMALNVSFGDGSPITPLEMHQIRKAIHGNMVFNRWEKGDVVMIDNFSTSHGRQPTYDKGRKIVVAWSDPVDKANELAKETGAWE